MDMQDENVLEFDNPFAQSISEDNDKKTIDNATQSEKETSLNKPEESKEDSKATISESSESDQDNAVLQHTEQNDNNQVKAQIHDNTGNTTSDDHKSDDDEYEYMPDPATLKENIATDVDESVNEIADLFMEDNNEGKEPVNKGNVEVTYATLTNEDKYGSDDQVYYKTAAVAEKLHISDQMLRQYCKAFSQFLDIKKTNTADPSHQHRLFRARDIEMLSNILEIKNRNNYTIDQTVDYLKSNKMAEIAIRPQEQRLELMVETFKDAVRDSIDDTLTPYLDSMKAVGKANAEETQNLKKQQENMEKQLLAKDQQILELQMQMATNQKNFADMIQEQNKLLEEQRQKTNEMLEKMNQQPPQKKRFSLFGRS